jgi:ADYC domain
MTMRLLLIVALLLLATHLLAAEMRVDGTAEMRVDGTAIVVTDASGQERRGSELDGAELDLGDIGTLRIIESTLDPDARFPGEVWLLRAQLRATGMSEFESICTPDAGGDSRMIFYRGYFDDQFRYIADHERFSVTCVSGVQGKCLRWGYLPWRKAPIGGASLAPYYESCIHMARADYCGDGQATTRDGTSVDIYDHVGVQQPTPDLADYHFEAGWGTHGAVCVHHARIADNLSLEDLPATCPRLSAPRIGSVCDEPHATELGALLYNRSKISARSSDLP